MRIAFITDLHIGLEGEDTYGIDVRKNFLAVLAAAVDASPDYVVLGGDLCYSYGDEAIYPWIKSQLDAYGIPYFFISGNHDEPGMLAKCFDATPLLKQDLLFFSAQMGAYQAVFLDTTKGYVNQEQLIWLKEQLAQNKQDALVFMHHPPVLAGVPFMDNNYPLKNHAELLALLQNHQQSVHVFCGHYHIEKTISAKQVMVYMTPSCFFQINQHTQDFKVDHYRPAWRVIDLAPDALRTTVVYLDPQ